MYIYYICITLFGESPQTSHKLLVMIDFNTSALLTRWRLNQGLCDVRSSVVNHVIL